MYLKQSETYCICIGSNHDVCFPFYRFYFLLVWQIYFSFLFHEQESNEEFCLWIIHGYLGALSIKTYLFVLFCIILHHRRHHHHHHHWQVHLCNLTIFHLISQNMRAAFYINQALTSCHHPTFEIVSFHASSDQLRLAPGQNERASKHVHSF